MKLTITSSLAIYIILKYPNTFKEPRVRDLMCRSLDQKYHLLNFWRPILKHARSFFKRPSRILWRIIHLPLLGQVGISSVWMESEIAWRTVLYMELRWLDQMQFFRRRELLDGSGCRCRPKPWVWTKFHFKWRLNFSRNIRAKRLRPISFVDERVLILIVRQNVRCINGLIIELESIV